jgi:hypothetical protein
MQSGVAFANTLTAPAKVMFEATTLTGAVTGVSGSFQIPAEEQLAVFLNQVPGFQSLPPQFRGILRISTTAGGAIAVTGLRGRYNERGDFLITTTPAMSETAPGTNVETIFPHLVVEAVIRLRSSCSVVQRAGRLLECAIY